MKQYNFRPRTLTHVLTAMRELGAAPIPAIAARAGYCESGTWRALRHLRKAGAVVRAPGGPKPSNGPRPFFYEVAS